MWKDPDVKGKSSFKISRQRKGAEGPNYGVRGNRNIINFLYELICACGRWPSVTRFYVGVTNFVSLS